MLVGPAAGAPTVRRGIHAGAVDDRYAARASNLQERAGMLGGLPGHLAAAVRPALDRIQNRLGAVAGEGIVDVDDQDDRPLAKSGPLPPAGVGVDLTILLGQELVPEPHDTYPPSGGLSDSRL